MYGGQKLTKNDDVILYELKISQTDVVSGSGDLGSVKTAATMGADCEILGDDWFRVRNEGGETIVLVYQWLWLSEGCPGGGECQPGGITYVNHNLCKSGVVSDLWHSL